VSGDWIKLGDVAPVSGEAAGILIGPAPPAGQTLSLDPAFIVSTAKSAGVLLAIPLDKPVMVMRTGNANPANVARPANPARQIAGEQLDGQVLVLVRDVPRGGVITDADLGWAAANPARPVRNGADLDGAIGMEAKRLLKAGQPLLIGDIKAAAVIRKGDPVTLIYATPGVKLTVDGVAQNEAAKGESVRVLNSYSKRTIEAVAHAPGEARVN
jgi:flagella basal body P-ring formation protein FlgA